MQHIMKHTHIRGQNELVDVCLEVKNNHKKVMSRRVFSWSILIYPASRQVKRRGSKVQN